MVKLIQFGVPTHIFRKKKDKNSGGDDKKNKCNIVGDEERKKEKDPSIIRDRLQQNTTKRIKLVNTESNNGGKTKINKMVLEKDLNDVKHKNSSLEAMRKCRPTVSSVLQTQIEAKDQHMGQSNNGLMLKPLLSLPEPISKLDAAAVKIQLLISKYPVVIFSRSCCCMCHTMTKLLSTVGAHPTVFELDEGEISALRTIGPPRNPAAPAVFIGGTCVGGPESLFALHVSGHLVPKLEEVGAFRIKHDEDDDNSGSDDDDNGGGDYDNSNGGGGKNNNDRDGGGNGDKGKGNYECGGEMKTKNMNFRGEGLFGYGFGYHAGNENGYPVGQLQRVQRSRVRRI